MGTSCYKPKPKIRKSFSRIESFTNTWIRSGYLDLEEMLKEFKDARLPLYLSDQYRYDILWKALVKTLEDKPDELKSQTVKKLVRK